jgi:hypothetical protein
VSATTPFLPSHVPHLHGDAPSVVASLFPAQPGLYAARGWRMFDEVDRVYVNDRARTVLGWQPRYDFAHVLACLQAGTDFRSPLAIEVGTKGYHASPTGVYTVR